LAQARYTVIVSERDDDYNLHLIGVGTGSVCRIAARSDSPTWIRRLCGLFPTPWRMLRNVGVRCCFGIGKRIRGAYFLPRQQRGGLAIGRS